MADSYTEKAIEEYIDDVETLLDAAYRYYVKKQLFSNARIQIVESEKKFNLMN